MEHLSLLEGIEGEVFNIAENTNPTLEEALTLAAETYRSKVPSLHLPLPLIKLIARVDGLVSGLKGKIPDLEYEAVKYLYYDYVVDNSKLEKSGFKLQYPNFKESMKQLGELYWQKFLKP